MQQRLFKSLLYQKLNQTKNSEDAKATPPPPQLPSPQAPFVSIDFQYRILR